MSVVPLSSRSPQSALPICRTTTTLFNRLALILIVIANVFVETDAQCAAGTGWDVSSCTPCKAGYFCTAGSRTVFGGGAVSTLAGSGSAGATDGTGIAATFSLPNGVSIHPNGTFALVAEETSNCIRRISLPGGVVTTLAGSGLSGSADGTGIAATFSSLRGISIDSSGAFAIVVDRGNNRIRRISLPGGVVTTVAGSSAGSADGTGTAATFSGSSGVSIDPSGTFALVADAGNNRIRRISLPGGVVTTLAGSGSSGSADGTGTAATFLSPLGVSIDPSGSFAIVSDGNNFIRRISLPGGIVTTLVASNSGAAVSIDPSGSFALVVQQDACLIYRISLPGGIVTTLAGSGSGDGMGLAASFSGPYGVSIDPSGSFALVTDLRSNRIRQITLSTLCRAGYYCPAGSSSANQSICVAGYYCPAGSSSANQSICGAGYYCPAGSSSIASQVLCYSGYYCPAGSSSANQSICGAGYYCPAGSSASNQTVCGAGYYCPSGSSASQLCTSGFYCPPGSGSNTILCPAGSYCTTPAVVIPCPGGYYCPSGTTSSVGAGQCDGGYYCPTGSSSPRQIVCPIRNYCPPLAAYLSGSFLACQLGSYCNSTGLSSSILCDAGSFCGNTLLTSPSGPCFSGFYCPAGSSSSNQSVCSAGYYCPVGSSSAQSCFLGSYCPSGSSSNTTVCPAGSYCPTPAAFAQCPGGYYCPAGTTSSIGAGQCDGGYYCPTGSSSANQFVCPIRNFCPSLAAFTGGSFIACQLGSYCNTTGLSSGILCDAGSYCANTLLTAPSGTCSAGFFCPAGSSSVQSCPAGSYCPAGSSSNTTLCPAGSYCPAPAAFFLCPGGYFCPSGTTSSVGAGQCDGGYYCPTGSSSSQQTVCPVRNFCPPLAAFMSGSFMSCQLGSYCNSTGLSSGIICDAGSFCGSSLLTAPTGPCFAGYYCPAGSFYGSANKCPAGSFCPAGSSVGTVCPAGTYCSEPGLTDISSARPCTSAQICPAGSVSPSTSCPSGYSCVGNGVLPCTAGNFCPGGNAGSVPCPVGSMCSVAQLGSPELCTGGYYCSSTGLTSVSGQCPIGKVCPVGSSAPSVCPSGFMCASMAMAVPSPCPSGRACTNLTAAVCPIGTYSFGNSTSCVSCPSGLYANSPGSSSCFHCALGSFSTTGSLCSTCPAGSRCLFGAFRPSSSADLRRVADSIPVTSNPFQNELSDSAAVLAQQTIFVLGGGGSLIIVMLLLALASQKFDSLGTCLNCRHSATLTWVDLDIFFARSHWTPAESTLPAQHRKTSFGGMLSLILIVTVAIVSVQLGTSNLAPTYSTSISIETPQWQPHGDYSLSVTMFGSGLGVCRSGVANSDILVQWTASDWSGPRPNTQFVYNEFDGSCVATWTCKQCKLISTSTTSLRVVVSSTAFSTHAQYVIKSPAFTTSAADPGMEYTAPFSVTGYVSSGDFSNLTAFQGGASVVTTLLTLFNVTLGSQQRIAYQPVVSNTLPGPVVTPETFDFSASAGFEYRFDLTRNSFSIVNIGQTSNIFNLIVLLLSLAGSIISGFTLLLPQLEKHLKIVTVWGAPAMKGDVVRNWSDKISELEVRVLLNKKQMDVIESNVSHIMANGASGSNSVCGDGTSQPTTGLSLAKNSNFVSEDKFTRFQELVCLAISTRNPSILLHQDAMALQESFCSPSVTSDPDVAPVTGSNISIELTAMPTLARRDINIAPVFGSSEYAQMPSPRLNASNHNSEFPLQSDMPMSDSSHVSPINDTSWSSVLVQRPVQHEPEFDVDSHSVHALPSPHVAVELSVPTKLPPPTTAGKKRGK